MNEKWSQFFSLPKNLTRDYLAGLLIGLGIGCMFGHVWLKEVRVYTLMAIGFSFVIVGAFMRPKLKPAPEK